jgi:hypothetical protein
MSRQQRLRFFLWAYGLLGILYLAATVAEAQR